MPQENLDSAKELKLTIPLEAAMISKEEVEQLVLDVSIGDVFTLHYRKNSQVLSLNFHFPYKEGWTRRDHIAAGIERAKLHCEKMRYRFIFCVPLVESLDNLEKRMPI